ncbi:MAG: hypothetical protein AB7P20_25260 [Rhizobiaceae bacterium]
MRSVLEVERWTRCIQFTLFWYIFTAVFAFNIAVADAAESAPEATRNTTIGIFTLGIPSGWIQFKENELTAFRRDYEAQSEAIYRQYSKSTNSNRLIDLKAFHLPSNSGIFVVVSSTIPSHLNLIGQLRSEAEQKGAWGIRQGYIKNYLGTDSIRNNDDEGFYVKSILNDGRSMISVGMQRKSLKNQLIQATILCQKSWSVQECSDAMINIINSIQTK